MNGGEKRTEVISFRVSMALDAWLNLQAGDGGKSQLVASIVEDWAGTQARRRLQARDRALLIDLREAAQEIEQAVEKLIRVAGRRVA